MGYLIALVAVLANVTASLLLKLAIDQSADKASPFTLSTAMPFIFSVLSYGAAFFMYAWSLRFLPLHVAQPLTSALPLVFIAISSTILFKEQITFVSGIGLILIGSGIAFLAFGARA